MVLKTQQKTFTMLILAVLCFSLMASSLHIKQVNATETQTHTVPFDASLPDLWSVTVDSSYQITINSTISTSNPEETVVIGTVNFTSSTGWSIEFINSTTYRVKTDILAESSDNFTCVDGIVQVIIDGTSITFHGSTVEHFTLSSSDYPDTIIIADSGDGSFTDGQINITITNYVLPAVSYGFQVWLLHSNGRETELTSGSPVALLNLTTDYVGYMSNTWTLPATTSLTLGYDALKVTVYLDPGVGSYSARATYLSPVLMANYIYISDWTFTLYVNRTGTDVSFSFGDTNHRSGITGLTFDVPLESDIQAWRLSRGDYVGFELGAYTDEFNAIKEGTGGAFYIFLILMVCAVFYFRTSNFGIVVFLFILFAGANSALFPILGLAIWAVPGIVAFFILGITFILWRVLHQ
jgi:hypothetical protein